MSSEMTPDRLPPQNLHAEKSVLGSMLRDNMMINDVVRIITADNFYSDAHQKIFTAMSAIYNQAQPVDLVILAERLKQLQQIDDVGGYPYLAELWDAAPTAANAVYYANIVREKSIIRGLIHASTEILRDAYDQAQSADELLSGAERKVLEIAEKGSTGEAVELKQALHEAYARIDVRSQRDPMQTSGLSTGYADLNTITGGFQTSELIILAARPSVGKCLAADSEIVLDTGEVATIGELYRRGRAGLLTLGDDWKLRLTEPSAYVDDGLKPVFRVTTRLGRAVETTASHPFRAFDGWRPLAELSVGDRVAVPRRVPVFGTESMRDCEVKLLAYLIGDGGLTGGLPKFTNANPRLRNEFARSVTEFGPLRVREEAHGGRTPTLVVSGDAGHASRERPGFGNRLREAVRASGRSARQVALAIGVTPGSLTYWSQGKCVPDEATFDRLCRAIETAPGTLVPGELAAIRHNGRNPMTRWLEGLGVWGRSSHDKFVPAPVFRLPRRQLALFLNRLFATDGWATVLSEGQTQLGYATVCERLARQVQHLLLRFGVTGKLRRKPVRYDGRERWCWQVDVTEPESIRAFASEIGFFGKEAALGRVSRALAGKRPKACRDTVPPAVWGALERAKGGESWAALADRAGLPGGNLHAGRRGLSRGRLAKLAAALPDAGLRDLAEGDVYWDEIVSIEPAGVKQVYDLTIPGTHNFVANDVCVHNTAMALNMIRHMIVEHREPVMFVSLEQARVELAERLLCMQARVSSHKLRTGQLDSDDMQRLIEAGELLRPAPLYIDDQPMQTMTRIAAAARRLKYRNGLKMVAIDYLQLIEPENRRDSRQEQVAQISRRLKFLARELAIPVMALAQVNRGSEDRQDHRPRLSDLRESGSIEQDADTVFLLHRKDRVDPAQPNDEIELIIGKQRNGPTGEVMLTYVRQYMRYENYAPDSLGGFS